MFLIELKNICLVCSQTLSYSVSSLPNFPIRRRRTRTRAKRLWTISSQMTRTTKPPAVSVPPSSLLESLFWSSIFLNGFSRVSWMSNYKTRQTKFRWEGGIGSELSASAASVSGGILKCEPHRWQRCPVMPSVVLYSPAGPDSGRRFCTRSSLQLLHKFIIIFTSTTIIDDWWEVRCHPSSVHACVCVCER